VKFNTGIGGIWGRGHEGAVASPDTNLGAILYR